MSYSLLVNVAIVSIIAFIVVMLIHPYIVKFAKKHNIVDNPDARKLQKTPIPILGGVAVFIGLIFGFFATSILFDEFTTLLPVFTAISVMLCVGVADDLFELTPRLRFFIELIVALLLIFWSGLSLNDFHGLWGVCVVPLWVSLPLSIVAIVGIINATNLVDGVDGLSSGYCISTSIAFFVMFYYAGCVQMAILCALSTGALLPFFFHNVFGSKSKMFIGDGGSLMMGVVMSTYIIHIISDGGGCEKYANEGISLVALTLAVMCVPVFDCVRVMTMRILRKTSPFRPDKTHMHHLFVELGFSHLGTTFSILLMNALVVLCWRISYDLKASIDVQFYVVIISGILLTAGFYKLMRINIKHNTALYRLMTRIGAKTHIENSKWWITLQKAVDFKHK